MEPREVAAAIERARYAVDRPETLDAWLKTVDEAGRRGDYLPHKVFADFLEENGLHYYEQTLTRLREAGPNNRAWAFETSSGKVNAIHEGWIHQSLHPLPVDFEYREGDAKPFRFVHRFSPIDPENDPQQEHRLQRVATPREAFNLVLSDDVRERVPFESVNETPLEPPRRRRRR